MADATHKLLLAECKQTQKKALAELAALSAQLSKTVQAIVLSNSSNKPGCSLVMDKITTIHELDKQVEKQVKRDVARNFTAMLTDKDRLAAAAQKTQDRLGDGVDALQRRAEIIDQKLRILENTLKRVNDT